MEEALGLSSSTPPLAAMAPLHTAATRCTCELEPNAGERERAEEREKGSRRSFLVLSSLISSLSRSPTLLLFAFARLRIGHAACTCAMSYGLRLCVIADHSGVLSSSLSLSCVDFRFLRSLFLPLLFLNRASFRCFCAPLLNPSTAAPPKLTRSWRGLRERRQCRWWTLSARRSASARRPGSTVRRGRAAVAPVHPAGPPRCADAPSRRTHTEQTQRGWKRVNSGA